MCLPPEWGRRGPPKAFTCGGLWAWLWKAPCSQLQLLLGRSHVTSLRCPPAGGAGGVRDCSRLSIRKLFPEFPKPGRAGGDAAMFLLVRLWTETIPLSQWPGHLSSLLSSHSPVTLNSPLIPSRVTRPTSLNSEENKFFFRACTLLWGAAPWLAESS